MRTTTYELREKGRYSYVRIPVVVRKGVAADDLDIGVVETLVGSYSDASLPDDIEAEIISGSHQSVTSIRLRFESAQGLPDGNYTVSVVVIGPDDEQQRLDVGVEHPAAQLRTLPTVVVDRTLCLWILCDAIDVGSSPEEHATVTIVETSGRSRVTNLSIDQIDQALSGSNRVSGNLLFEASFAVPPGGSVDAPFELRDEFPIGTTTGSLTLDAPQLASPVEATYEVRTRLGDLVIIPLAAAGIFLGWVTRWGLKRYVERGEALEEAQRVITMIERERSKSSDESFHTALDRLTERVTTAKTDSKKDPATLRTQVAEVVTDLRKEVAGLWDRRATALGDLEVFQRGFSLTRTGPAAIRAIVEQGTKDSVAIEGKIAAFDVKGATDALADLKQRLTVELQAAALSWGNDLRPLLDTMQQPEGPLPKKVSDELTDAATAISAAIQNIEALDAAEPPDAVLKEVNRIHIQLSATMNSYVPQVAELLDTLRERLCALDNPNETPLATLQERLAELETERIAFAKTLDRSSAGVARALDAALTASGAAVLEQRADLPGDLRTKLEGSIAAGDYLAAAELLKRLPASQVGETATASFLTFEGDLGDYMTSLPYGTSAGRTSQTAAALADHQALSVIPVASGVGRMSLQSGPMHESLAAISPRRALFLARSIFSFLLLIPLIIVAFVLFEDTFVGTWNDIAAVFFWAYGIDLTVDALATATGKLPQPS
ncbi:MAG: hypothetical protein M3N53_08845 [Actinomycetota bacterium]|nr:hypothetical protein [Actinomycetota bacterium]